MPPNKFRRVQKGKIVGKRRPAVKSLDLRKPWVTEGIKAEFGKKDELLKSAKATSSPDDWAKYREQREKCTQVYGAAKLEYIGQHPEEVRIPQLMPEAQGPPPVNTAPIDYTADVVL